MNSVEHSIQNLMPDGISVEEEIRRIQDAPKGEILYTIFAFNDSNIEWCEGMLKKANISFSIGHNGESIIYTKL